MVGWSVVVVVLGLAARDSISVYIRPSPREREKEERKEGGEQKCPNNPPPAPTASTIGPCPTIIQIVGRPGTGSLPRTIAPSDYPLSGGAKVLGKLSVPERPTSLDDSRARAYCACSRWGGGLFGHFFSHLSFLFSFSLSLGDGPI